MAKGTKNTEIGEEIVESNSEMIEVVSTTEKTRKIRAIAEHTAYIGKEPIVLFPNKEYSVLESTAYILQQAGVAIII